MRLRCVYIRDIGNGIWKHEGLVNFLGCEMEGCGMPGEYADMQNESQPNYCQQHAFQIIKFRSKKYDASAEMRDENNTEMNGMTAMEGKQIGLVVSLKQGVKETNYADSIGRLLPKKGQNGQVIKTKNGEPVMQLALDLTNLRAMIDKHALKAVDKRSGHDIIWCTGFVSEIRTKGSGAGSSGF